MTEKQIQVVLFCGYVFSVGCIVWMFCRGHDWRTRFLISFGWCLWIAPLIQWWMMWHYHWADL